STISSTPPAETVDNFSNSVIMTNLITKYISPGRVTGDVNGDGLITLQDSNLALEAVTDPDILDSTQTECAKILNGSSISINDVLTIQNIANGKEKAGKYSRDVLGTWTVNPNYSTEDRQFYLDVTDADALATTDF